MKFLSKISFRFIVQFAILCIIIILALLHLNFGIEKAAPIDAYCPFGAIESFFTLIFKGEFLKRIFTSSFILLGIFFVANLFLGRIFCGYFCPLGALQEWIRLMGKKIGIKKDVELPKKIDKYMRLIKYIILIIIIYFSFYLGDLVFRAYDPYNALMHFGGELEEKIIGYTILIMVLITALFSKSWWCRYFCPLGGFFGIIRKFSFLKIARDSNTCISCGLCDNNCPTNLEIKTSKNINNSDCISCGKCIGVCPKNSLKYKLFNKEISTKYFSAMVIVLVILPLIIAPFTVFWQTKSESNIINISGKINIADIRGSNTLKYLLETTKVPFTEFQTELNLPKNIDTSLMLKEIGYKYNLTNKNGNILETSDFRDIVENYMNNSQKSSTNNSTDCPFGKTDCEFPEDCGAYIDSNGDKICDHSQ